MGNALATYWKEVDNFDSFLELEVIEVECLTVKDEVKKINSLEEIKCELKRLVSILRNK